MNLRKLSKEFFVVLFLLLVSLWSTQTYAVTEDEKNNIAVYEKVADGVVNVTSTTTCCLIGKCYPRDR